MKTLSEFYQSIKGKFYNKTKLDIQEGTTIDSYVLAAATVGEEAMKEIEANKTPHIFTSLKGSNADGMGYLVNCPRGANEPDDSYLFKLMNWTLINETGNYTAIEAALINMQYASHVSYVPFTQGVGTATAYIIPRNYDDETKQRAIAETQARLRETISPGAYVSYVIPKTIPVKLAIYINSEKGNLQTIQENLSKKIQKYINDIAIGDYMDIGYINKMGVNETNVDYFQVAKLFIDGKEVSSLKILQVLESKLLFDQIIWWTAVR